MKKIVKIIYILFSLIFLFYLGLPNPAFPQPPDDSLQSDEPADTETPLRRAYFTNYTRQQILSYYEEQLNKSKHINLPINTYRLNYPPEEAQILIRDQTRSTFLEEIVHPFRESFFVNGFEPKDPKDTIIIQGKTWRQKIIVRYVPSNILVRLAVGVLTFILTALIYKGWCYTLLELKKEVSKKWIFR